MNRVFLPANELSDSEIFAPAFKTGTRVSICAMFPVGPTIELIVNNRNPNVTARYENAGDIVAANSRVAEKIWVDFSGDLVFIKPIEEVRK